MKTALRQLVAALGDAVRTDPVTIENYRFDWSRDPTAGVPAAVVRPLTAADVQTTIRWAAEHRVPVVPRGAGSGLSGGSSAVAGGIVLSLERMRSIEIDIAARVAVVEAGAFNAEVKAAAAQHGLWYPPDPSSYEICSIGGNIATNAGGLCCVKYGVTTDYVLGLDVVLADGTLITLGGKRIKDVAGLSLLKLFVGSGGTLGIITRAILRLIPAQGPRSTLVAYFPTVQAAADTVVTIGSTLAPRVDDGADGSGRDQCRRGLPLDGTRSLRGRDAHRPVRCPGRRRHVPRRSNSWRSPVRQLAPKKSSSPATRTRVNSSSPRRRAAFPAIEAPRLHPAGGRRRTSAATPSAVVGHRGASRNDYDVEIPVVAHAGDGNTHPIIVFDRGDPAARDRAYLAFARSCSWRSSSAAPSPVSMELAGPRKPPCLPSSALT